MTRGAFVDLQAEPDSGFTFAAFTGACAPHGRMTLMQPETCGATFTKIPEGPVVPKVQLTIVPPQGGTIIGDGITCGTMGTECQTEHAQGKLVTLKHLADPEFTFKGFTGECARTGETLMNKPHRCGALFVRDRPAGNSAAGAAAGGGAASGAGGLASSSGIRPRPGGGGVGVGGGVGSSAGGGPSGAGGDPTFTRDASHPGSAPEIDKDGRDVKEPAAPPSPEGIAKDDIQKLLEAYRKAYEARDVDRIKSLYPTASDRFTNGLKYAFKEFKSVEYKYTTPPEFVELNPALGQATVKIGALLTAESRGPKSPPQKQKILFTLQRQQGTWSIGQLEASPEK
jgi:hypothetical protein